MRTWVALVFLLMTTISCSHLGQSGVYIKLGPKDTLSSLSKRFKLPKSVLLAANPNREIRAGTLFFIPQNRGLLGRQTISEIVGGRSPATVAPSYAGREFIWPVPATNRISSYYGRRWGRKHEGIDIPAPRGTRIVAAADGLVVYAGAGLGGYGNIVVLGHPNGYFTVYAHTHRILVVKGQKVRKGQLIAQVGSTGRSTGPHLHFEIRYAGQSYNPLDFISRPYQRRRYAKR